MAVFGGDGCVDVVVVMVDLESPPSKGELAATEGIIIVIGDRED